MNETTSLHGLLLSIGLTEHLEKLVLHKIDIDVLAHLSEEDLANLEIPLGDRKRLLSAFKTELEKIAIPQEPSVVDAPFSVSNSEKRQITALFIDLVDSTGLSNSLDVEDYHRVLSAFHKNCTDAAANFQGHVSQIAGDGVLLVFGYPTSTEQDSELAASAALQLLNSDVTSKRNPLASIRIGIATGIALVADVTNTDEMFFTSATGSALNLAARLQSVAESNSILVCSTTHRLLKSKFDMCSRGEHILKGFDAPQHLFKLIEKKHSGYGATRNSEYLSEFIGRASEIEQLHYQWSSVTAISRNQFVFISGDPGIGKTRLIEEAVTSFTPSPNMEIRLQCSPANIQLPFHPLIEFLKSMLNLAQEDTVADVIDKVNSWIAIRNISDSEISDVILQLTVGSITTDLARVSQKRFFPAVLKLVTNLSLATQASVLLIEDLQWIDPSTEKLLDLLIARYGTDNLLIVCTHRPEYSPKWTSEPAIISFALPRLAPTEARELGLNLSDQNLASRSYFSQLLEKADGTPLYIEELFKDAADNELAWNTGNSNSQIEKSYSIPPTLRSLLQARLDRVEFAQDIAPVAAAIGRTFSSDVLSEVTRLDEKEVHSVLNLLVGANLLIKDVDSTERQYRFRHSLIQDAAYERLPKDRKRLLHARIRKALSKNSRDTPPNILALHATLAADFDNAREYYIAAALIARSNYANIEAISLLKQALSANEHEADEQQRSEKAINIRQLMYVPLQVTASSESVVDNLEKLISLRVNTGKRDGVVNELHALSGIHILQGRTVEAKKCARQLIDLAQSHNDEPLILGLRCLGLCEFMHGRFQTSATVLRKLLSVLNEDTNKSIRDRLYYANTKIICKVFLHWMDSIEISDNCLANDESIVNLVAEVESEEDPHSRAYALSIISSIFQFKKNTSLAADYAKKAIIEGMACESSYWVAWPEVVLGWSEVTRGNSGEGLRHLLEGIAKYEATGAKQMLPYALAMLADSYACCDNRLLFEETLMKFHEIRRSVDVAYADNYVARVITESSFSRFNAP